MKKENEQGWLSRKGLTCLVTGLVVVCAAGCGAQEPPDPLPPVQSDKGKGAGWSDESRVPVWESVRVSQAPVLDGQVDEVWAKARPLTIYVREAMGGDHPKQVVLRSVHTADSFFVLAQWPDATRSDMRDPYVWNKEQQVYDRPSRPDDQFALQFPMTEDFAISMLTVTRSYKADVWHWKAGRGNPIGWVDDKYHVISQKPIDHPKAVEHALHGKRNVYILRAQDAGTSPYKVKEAPRTNQGERVDSFVQQEPDGSMADVRGKGIHDGKGWTLEMGRRFDTGHPADDAVINPGADTRCAIAVLDDELYEEHSVSSLILLRFVDVEGGEKAIDFENAEIGKLPAGFTAALTGTGAPGEWTIQEDAHRFGFTRVLAQTRADKTGKRYPLCILDGVNAKDVDVSVDLKPVSGEGDQAGGLVWRMKDKDNFYVVRANALENNVVAYKTVDGVRTSIGTKDDPNAYGVKAPVAAQQWQTLRVRAVGNRAEVFLNGRKLFDVEDATFAEPGKVGLWTKADSVTHFCRLRVRPLDVRR